MRDCHPPRVRVAAEGGSQEDGPIRPPGRDSVVKEPHRPLREDLGASVSRRFGIRTTRRERWGCPIGASRMVRRRRVSPQPARGTMINGGPRVAGRSSRWRSPMRVPFRLGRLIFAVVLLLALAQAGGAAGPAAGGGAAGRRRAPPRPRLPLLLGREPYDRRRLLLRLRRLLGLPRDDHA